MATHMPPTGSAQHVASVNYTCTFSSLVTAGGRVTFAIPGGTTFLFQFETGRVQPNPQVDLAEVTWDYSYFDQDAEEASIAQYMTSICGMIAQLLRRAQADVEQAVSIQRVWTVTSNEQGAAVPRQYGDCTITEPMPYPPRVTDADVVSGSDAGEHVVQG